MIVETATFRLVEGADQPAAVAAEHELQVRFANLAPGMLRRTTARSADGEWLVVTLWGSEEDAVAAERAGADDAAVAAFAELVEGDPVVRRYQDLGG